jgi:hypothetical protein
LQPFLRWPLNPKEKNSLKDLIQNTIKKFGISSNKKRKRKIKKLKKMLRRREAKHLLKKIPKRLNKNSISVLRS